MEKILFRPNAPLSSLFDDLPCECILIDEEAISETVTDYQGNILAYKSFKDWDIESLKTIITLCDNNSQIIESHQFPEDCTWEFLCTWLLEALLARGWIPMKSGQMGKTNKSVNGQEIFFEMELDDAN